MKTRALIKRFLPYFKKYKAIMLIDLFCAAMTTGCELVLPMMVKYITDGAMDPEVELTVRSILIIGAVYIALRILDSAGNYYMANIGHVMGARIETDMRKDLFDHLQSLSHSFYTQTKVGQIMARVTSDLFDVTEFAHHCPEEFFIAAIKIIVSFCILITMNIWLTLVIFIMLPIMIACTTYFRKKRRIAFRESRVQIGELNSQVEDSLLGIRVVKSFTAEEKEIEKFGKGNEKFLKIKKSMYKYMAGFNTTTRIFDGLMYIVVVVMGALLMLDGRISAGDFIAYLLYITTLLTAIRRIVEFTEQFERGMTGIERFFEIMDVVPDITDKTDSKVLEEVKGEIRFDHVSFKYEQGEDGDIVLDDINLTIKPGQNVAVVGPSGGGKSTLCNLIPRFYDVTAGRILIDGTDIRELTLKSLRSNIGMVQQEVYLFAGSVYANIEYGNPGASKEDIERAAKQAGAHEFIMKLPEGYSTYVGERGLRLSGGQKQRISIARMFLKNPPILLLDEATSALDNESERIVQMSLEKLAADRTTLVIAHRLTTIRNADVIWVLTEKGIEEIGSHQELMKKKGIYYELYRLYTENA